MTTNGPLPLGSDDWFVALLAPSHSRLYRYIASIVPSASDAEDLFQKTLLTAWQRRQTYDPQRDFFAWLTGVARNHVRHYLRSAQRSRVVLAPDVIEQLADRLAEDDDDLQHRQAVLTACLEQLPPRSREMIERFYRSERSVKEFAGEIRAGVEATYKALQRIRAALQDCVSTTLSREVG